MGPWPAPSSPGEEDRLRRPGRAPGTIPSCIIYVNTVRRSPHPSLRPLGGEGIASPPPRFCTFLSDTVTVSLQASPVAKAGPALSGPVGSKALGPFTPKKKKQCGGEGREGLAQSHRWKGINSPKVPLPAPAWSGLHGLCPESPMSGHWAWALWEGADPRGKQRASQGTPTFSH